MQTTNLGPFNLSRGHGRKHGGRPGSGYQSAGKVKRVLAKNAVWRGVLQPTSGEESCERGQQH